MADERYGWLDQEAAERLLRGEPVDAADDYSRLQAERLAEALENVRRDVRMAGPAATSGPSGLAPEGEAAGELAGELAGEADALKAFRAARAAGAPQAGATVGRPDLDSVRIGTALRSGRRAVRPGCWLRPARWGLAASVAGLAVGGVAVAAGTGVLPAFGGDAEPAPVASASAPPHPDGGGLADVPPGSAHPSAPTHPGAVPSLASPLPSGGRDGAGTQDPDAGGPSDNDGGKAGRPDDGARDRNAVPTPESAWPAQTTQACRDFRDGRLDSVRRQHLEAAARASGGVQRFCDQVLNGGRQTGATTPSTGAPTTGGGTGTDNDTGTGTGGTGSGDGDGDSDRARDPERGGKRSANGTGADSGAGGAVGGKASGGTRGSAASWTTPDAMTSTASAATTL